MKRPGIASSACMLLVICMCFGCARVTPVRTANTPEGMSSDTKGMPASSLRHFKAVYPDGSFAIKRNQRLVVGPVLLNREALLFLSRDDRQRVKVDAAAGDSRVMAEVSSGSGEPSYFVAETFSYSAQSVLTEAMTAAGNFSVLAPEKDAGASPDYPALSKKGIHYFLAAHADAPKDAGKGTVRVYLSLVDTATREIVAAVMGQGGSIEESARNGANRLVNAMSKAAR